MTKTTITTQPPPTELAPLDGVDICTAHVLLLEHRRDKMKSELTQLQDRNAALLAAYADEANRADKAEAEVARLLQLLTPSLASITIGEICGQKQESKSA